MSAPLPIIPDEEARRSSSESEAAGFGALSTGRGLLPLKAMDVRCRIDGLLAHLEVSQTFANRLDEPLEATYIFPLPDRAAVSAFRLEVKARSCPSRP